MPIAYTNVLFKFIGGFMKQLIAITCLLIICSFNTGAQTIRAGQKFYPAEKAVIEVDKIKVKSEAPLKNYYAYLNGLDRNERQKYFAKYGTYTPVTLNRLEVLNEWLASSRPVVELQVEGRSKPIGFYPRIKASDEQSEALKKFKALSEELINKIRIKAEEKNLSIKEYLRKDNIMYEGLADQLEYGQKLIEWKRRRDDQTAAKVASLIENEIVATKGSNLIFKQKDFDKIYDSEESLVKSMFSRVEKKKDLNIELIKKELSLSRSENQNLISDLKSCQEELNRSKRTISQNNNEVKCIVRLIYQGNKANSAEVISL